MRWGCWRRRLSGWGYGGWCCCRLGEERARPTEEALRGSGADWTVVRASWFAQNFSEGPLVEGLREGGELVFPGGPVREPPP